MSKKWTVCDVSGVDVMVLFNDRNTADLKRNYYLFETDDEVRIQEPFKYNGKYYTARGLRPQEGLALVEQFYPNPEPEEMWGENNITCPYCGEENIDSFEMPNSEDEHECSECGSKFSYERVVDVTYTMTPVSKFEIKEIRG